MVMDKYTILCTELRGSAQSLNGNIDTLQKKADKLQKAINKVTRGDYKASDLSSAYTAQTALTGSITRLGEICGAMNTAALQFSEASAELSGRANLTAYYMQHTDTLSYEGLMGTYSAAIASAGSAAAGYELLINTLIENGNSADSVGYASNAVQNTLPINKATTISTYETQNPDTAKKLNDFLSNTGLSDSDIEDVKYLAYTAPEPYRSLYLEHLESYKMKVKENTQSRHNSLTNVMTIEGNEALSNDPKSPYTTFFHESGHAIDDFERRGFFVGDKAAFQSSKYEYQNKTMFEYITEDVRKNVSEYISTTYGDLTDEQRNTILHSMNLTDDADFAYQARNNGLSDPYLNQIRTEILDHYVREELAGCNNNAVCDIYGGVTNEVFYEESTYKDGVYYGHADAGSTYWYGKVNVLKGGWSGENCDMRDHTGRQASELWAEFFAAQMTRNEAALANIKEHFPTAYEAMEQMAQDMANS